MMLAVLVEFRIQTALDGSNQQNMGDMKRVNYLDFFPSLLSYLAGTSLYRPQRYDSGLE